MAQVSAEQRGQRLKYNLIVAQVDIVLNVDLGTCPFITLQNFRDKYAELSVGQDVQEELSTLGFDVFEVVEKHFPAFTAMRDPNLPGLLRRNVIDRPAQSALTFADGDHRVQGSSNRAAIEAPVEVAAQRSDADLEGRIGADVTVNETTECDLGRKSPLQVVAERSDADLGGGIEAEVSVKNQPTEDPDSLPAAAVSVCTSAMGQYSVPEHIAARKESLRKRLSSPEIVAPPLAKPVVIELGFPGITPLPKAIPMPSFPLASVIVASVEVRPEEEQMDRSGVATVSSTTARDVRSDVAHDVPLEPAREIRSESARDAHPEVAQELSFETTQEERSETVQMDLSEPAQHSEMVQEDSFETAQETRSESLQDGRSESMQEGGSSERVEEVSSESVMEEKEETSDTADHMFTVKDRSEMVDRYPSLIGVSVDNSQASVVLTTLSDESSGGDAFSAAPSVAMPPGFDVLSTSRASGIHSNVPHTGHESHLEPPPGFNSSSGRASSASTAQEEYPPWSTSTMEPLPANTPDDEEQLQPAWSSGDGYYDDPHADEAIFLTEEREEQWGIDTMDRIPTVGDFGMPAVIGRPPSARRVLPIRRPSPDHRQSQFATRRSPTRDPQVDRAALSSNPSNAATRRPSPRPDPYFLSDSEEGSTEPLHEEEEQHLDEGALNTHDYVDEYIGAPMPVPQQTEAEPPSDAQESRDLLLDWDEEPVAHTPVQSESVVVEEASTVPAQEPPQLTAKKATEEKLKALYSEGRQRTQFPAMDEPDFDCDAMSRSRPRQAPRSAPFFGTTPHADAFFGTDPEADAFGWTTSQARGESAEARPQTADQEPSDSEMPPLHHATPTAASPNATAESAPLPDLNGSGAIPLPPPPARSDQPAPLDLSKPIPMPAPQAHEVKPGPLLEAERSESGTTPPTAGVDGSRTAPSQGAVHSRESSAASVVEYESSSSGFRTPREEPAPSSEGDSFARTDAPPDTFDTAEEGSEEEETRTARPSGSSLTADMPATPKALHSTSAVDHSAGGFELSLEQFGLHELLPELLASAHPGSQPIPASAASFGSTAATAAQPAAIARGFEDFFDSHERSMTAPSSAHTAASRFGAVDLECFAADFLEELPSDALPTQGLDAQPSPAPSASPAAPPECEPYVMRDEWHIDNYEAASEERRRLCAESADFREPPPETVRAWIDQVTEIPVLLDTLLDLEAKYPDGFMPDEFAHYEYDFACTERHAMYHWAATTNVIGLHRMLELGMLTVDVASRRFRVNDSVLDVKLMALPYNFCSNFYRCLEFNGGEMEVRQAMKFLKSFEPPPTRLCDRDLLHLINHFPRVFLLECKDKEYDFFKATIKLNPDLPKWRVILDVNPHAPLFMPIPGCPHPLCNGVPPAS